MLMIRLQRKGAKHNPIYRMVVSDSRKRPTSDVIEQVGFYNPHSDPPELRVDLERVEYWRGQGAQVSETVRSLIKKAAKSAQPAQ
jgi:small subunit ribosomal protein S16